MIKMLHDKVLVRPFIAETSTSSGIVLTTKQEEEQRGEVLAVGPGRYDERGNFIETSVKVGDVIVFTDKSSHSIELNGEKLVVLFEPEVYGVLHTIGE